MGQADDGLDDGGVTRSPVDLGHEGLVDLEEVDREALQILERGVAGPEVVDGQLHAHVGQQPQLAVDPGGIGHEHALSDLEAQAGRLDAGVGQQGGHRVRKGPVFEVAAGDVDRELDDAQVRRRRFLARGPEHELVELGDDARLLSEGDELRRRDRASFRMSPPGQRLDARHDAGPKGDNGLIEDLELLPLDGPPKVALDGEAPHGPHPHLLVEELEAVPALLLGPVQGGVCVAQHGLGCRLATGPVQHDADADGHVHLVALDCEGATEPLLDALGDGDRLTG